MDIFKARGGCRNNWWTLEMIHFDIVAEGDSEAAMLADLCHQLKGIYAISLHLKRQPFVEFVTNNAKAEVAWNEGHKTIRKLDIPDEVRDAMCAALGLKPPACGDDAPRVSIAVAA